MGLIKVIGTGIKANLIFLRENMLKYHIWRIIEMINIKDLLSKKNIKFYEVNVPEIVITEGFRIGN